MMMTLKQSNTEGIKKAAEEKREKAFQRTEAAIKQLIKEGKEISFASVAQAAGVSRPWLYQNESVRARIEQLRNQTEAPKKLPSNLKPSESSKDTMIATLRERLRKLEYENRGLREHLEVAYGLAEPQLVEKAGAQQRVIEELTQQNKHLSNLLNEARAEIEFLKQKNLN
jgi:hypothetical protein